MLHTNFSPFPILITERLLLRQLEPTDAPVIFAHRQDEVVNTYLDNFRHQTIEQTREFISRVNREIADQKTILWVLTEQGNNKFIGTVCLWNISKNEAKAETGYTLDPEFHGKGYMHEALEKVIDFGFKTIKLKSIEAYTHEENQGSIKLLLRNNFQPATPSKPELGNKRIFFMLSNEQEI